MRQLRLTIPIWFGLWFATLAGCAAQSTVTQTPIRAVSPGMARVWFYRPQLTPQFGAVTAFSPVISANGAPIADIPPGTTFYRDFAPGTYRFTVQPLGLPTPQATTLALAPGTQDYLLVDWIPSWTQGYPQAGYSFSPNTFGILSSAPQVAQAYIPTLNYLGER
jgi:hypothetical protein